MIYQDTTLLIILNTLVFFICLANLAYCFATRQPRSMKMFSLLLVLYGSYVFFIPGLYDFVTSYERSVSYASPIDPNHLLITYVIEILFLLVLLTTLHITFQRSARKPNFVKSIPGLTSISKDHGFLLFLTLACLLTVYDQMVNQLAAYGRLVTYNAATAFEVKGVLGLPQALSTIWVALIVLPGKVAAAVLLTSPKKALTKNPFLGFFVYKIIPSSLLLLVFVYGFVVGVRMRSIEPLIILAVVFFLRHGIDRRVITLGATTIFIIVTLGPVVGTTYRTAITQKDARGDDFADRITLLFELTTGTSSAVEGSVTEKLVGEFRDRLVDANLSSGLVRTSLNNGHVWHNPAINSMISFIPRAIWLDRPAAKSGDGTQTGVAGFIVWRELSGRTFGNWGGYTAASHSFWEFNILGVFLWALVYGLIVSVTLRRYGKTGEMDFREIDLLFLLLILRLYKFDAFLIPSGPDMILTVTKTIVPLLILKYLCDKVFFNFKIHRKRVLT